MPTKTEEINHRKKVCRFAHQWIQQLGEECRSLPAGTERKAVLEVFGSEVKTAVLVKFILQMGCVDYLSGRHRSIFPMVASEIAHQYWDYRIGLDNLDKAKKRRKKK